MNVYCNFCSKMLLIFFTLFLAMGSLSAQSNPNCDLSKCTSAERELCAKICSGTPSAVASLINSLSPEPIVKKTNCNPANCNPNDCKKKGTTNVRLVSEKIKTAPNYSSSLDAKGKKESNLEKKKCCAVKCSKAKVKL